MDIQWGFSYPIVIHPLFGYIQYFLVNIQKTMENHKF